MAACCACPADSLGNRRQQRLAEQRGGMELVWICRTCQSEHQSVIVYSRVAAFPLVWKAVIPVMAIVFSLVILGLHLA